MASNSRRSIIARTKLFYQQQQHRFAPSFSHFSSRDCEELPPKSICRNSEIRSQFLINRNYGSNPLLSRGNVTRLMQSEVPVAHYGLNFRRNLSNMPLEAAPAANEVAVAAADSFAPVAAYQHLIDYVHCYTGLDWWASIAATTLLLRLIHLPAFIFLTKSCAFIKKKPNILELMESGHFQRLWPTVGKILNMAEKVPSFTTGGTLWFTDLTTPDRIYLPILWALTREFRVQLHPVVCLLHPKSSYNPLEVALFGCGAAAAGFPTAIYCYGITTNLFFIAFGKLLTYPQVRKLLELPAVVKKS